MKKQIASILLSTMIITASGNIIHPYPVIIAEAHSGRTDSQGGHKDNKNKSGLGSYHYHCGGNPAHLHANGVCPYSVSQQTTTVSSASATAAKESETSNEISQDTIIKVQEKLNEKGYDCGTADGIAGQKTKEALENFQKDNQLTVDGIIGEEVLKALEISN